MRVPHYESVKASHRRVSVPALPAFTLARTSRVVVYILSAVATLAASASTGEGAVGDDPPLVYPEGEPRAGELIQPVKEVRTTDAHQYRAR